MEEKVYECTIEFELSKWDNDNDCFSDEIMTVEKGSVWRQTDSGYICSGEVRLENDDDATWIEISKKTLKEYFKDIQN